MMRSPAPDANDWRTWRRDGERLYPPPGTTSGQSMAAMQALFMARRGIDPAKPANGRRDVLRILKKADGRYVQVSYTRVVGGKTIDIRVRGGCRFTPKQPGR